MNLLEALNKCMMVVEMHQEVIKPSKVTESPQLIKQSKRRPKAPKTNTSTSVTSIDITKDKVKPTTTIIRN